MAEAAKIEPVTALKESAEAQEIVVGQVAKEIVLVVVGHVGSGNTKVAEALKEVLSNHKLGDDSFAVEIIKARTVIEEGMKLLGTPLVAAEGKSVPPLPFRYYM